MNLSVSFTETDSVARSERLEVPSAEAALILTIALSSRIFAHSIPAPESALTSHSALLSNSQTLHSSLTHAPVASAEGANVGRITAPELWAGVGAVGLCALVIVLLRRGAQAAMSSFDIDENDEMTSWTTDHSSIDPTNEGHIREHK
jgi:hypothetical protein